MTAALFQCALAFPQTELHFMAGDRPDLTGISNGTERPHRIAIDWLLAERQEAQLREAWRHFHYAEAAQGAQNLIHKLGADQTTPPATRQRLALLRDASRAFDEWNRFNHAEAAKKLHDLVTDCPNLSPYADQAEAAEKDEAVRLHDLRLNADRCADQGKFDDAVARYYRLIEATGQWQLSHVHGIDSAKLDWSKISTDEARTAGFEHLQGEKTLSGLVQTLKLAAAKHPGGPIDRFLKEEFPGKRKCGEKRLLDMLDMRNNSILAHGSKPLSRSNYEKWRDFMAHWFEHVIGHLQPAETTTKIIGQFPTEPPF